MAAQTPPSAYWVADEFKKKYYDVLSNNPRLFARFFKEDSALTVSLPDAQPASANGPEGIQQLMEYTAPGAKVSVTGLQAQYGVSTASPDANAAAGAGKGGVMDRVIVVHVDGRILLQGEPADRRFSQVFCLAPQTNPKGYYVRNDILSISPPRGRGRPPRWTPATTRTWASSSAA